MTMHTQPGDAGHARHRNRETARRQASETATCSSPVNVRLMGDPEDIPQAAAAIIAAATAQGWTVSEPSRPYPNHGGPGVRVFFDLTREDPT